MPKIIMMSITKRELESLIAERDGFRVQLAEAKKEIKRLRGVISDSVPCYCDTTYECGKHQFLKAKSALSNTEGRDE